MEVLEIGNGLLRRPETTVAIDKCWTPSVDIVRDVAKRGIPFAEDTFDEVYSMDVIEHIEFYDDLIFLINEIWRVLKPKGVWKFTTPLGLPGLADHITHHRCFSKESFAYYGEDLTADYEHMRKSDGIVARFKMEFGKDNSSLYGSFEAIK